VNDECLALELGIPEAVGFRNFRSGSYMGQRVYEIEDLVRWVQEVRDDRSPKVLPYHMAIHLQCACRKRLDMVGLKFWAAVAERLEKSPNCILDCTVLIAQ
jgi:hypothetical protein